MSHPFSSTEIKQIAKYINHIDESFSPEPLSQFTKFILFCSNERTQFFLVRKEPKYVDDILNLQIHRSNCNHTGHISSLGNWGSLLWTTFFQREMIAHIQKPACTFKALPKFVYYMLLVLMWAMCQVDFLFLIILLKFMFYYF